MGCRRSFRAGPLPVFIIEYSVQKNHVFLLHCNEKLQKEVPGWSGAGWTYKIKKWRERGNAWQICPQSAQKRADAPALSGWRFAPAGGVGNQKSGPGRALRAEGAGGGGWGRSGCTRGAGNASRRCGRASGLTGCRSPCNPGPRRPSSARRRQRRRSGSRRRCRPRG